MTDMYLSKIDRRRSRTGCFVLIGLAVVLAVGAFLLFKPSADRADDAEPRDAEERVEQDKRKPAAAPRDDAGPADDQAREWLQEAREAKARQDYLAARELGWRILDEARNQHIIQAAEELLNEVNITLVMNPWPMPEKVDYTIQRGDTLGGLARRFNTTVDLIQRGNRLTGPMIRVGDRLRILDATFSMEVSKSRNDLVLYLNDRFFKRYRVGTGEYQRTPVGEFQITDRIPQPTWWRQDGRAIPYGTTNNVLGTHWLSIDVPGYGIHGTWEPESIGYQSSAGCVRLLNEDIEELYTLVPVGTRVVIVE